MYRVKQKRGRGRGRRKEEVRKTVVWYW